MDDLEQALLARVRRAVQGEEHVEVAREEGRRAVVRAHRVASLDRARQLMPEGRQVRGEERPVPRHDRLPERLGVGRRRPGLQRGEPAAPIEERARRRDAVPEGGRVADGGRVVDEHAIELPLDPAQIPEHDVDVHARRGVEPLVAGLEEAVVDLHARARRGDGGAGGERHRLRPVDVEVEVRARTRGARGARPGERDRLDLG